MLRRLADINNKYIFIFELIQTKNGNFGVVLLSYNSPFSEKCKKPKTDSSEPHIGNEKGT